MGASALSVVGRWKRLTGLLLAPLVVGAAVAVGASDVTPERPAAPDPEAPAVDALVYVSDDMCVKSAGCDAVSVFDIGTLAPLYLGSHLFCSPGRIAGDETLSLVVAYPAQGGTELEVVRRTGPQSWTEQLVRAEAFLFGTGGVALDPTGENLLVAAQERRFDPRVGLKPPFSVRRYLVSEIANGRLGPARGKFEVEGAPYEILVSKDGSEAHIVSLAWDRGAVHTVRIPSMDETSPYIETEAPTYGYDLMGVLHATLSPDGRYLVANMANKRELIVADTVDRSAWSVRLPARSGGRTPGGIAFNHALLNHGLLAVHSGTRVEIYRLDSGRSLVPVASERIPGPEMRMNPGSTVHAAIGWSTDGSRLIVGTDSDRGWVIFGVAEEGHKLSVLGNLRPCQTGRTVPNDVLTANVWLPPPTATPSATATHFPTATPSTTNPPTQTPTVPSTPVSSKTPVPTNTPARPPGFLFFPIVLREECEPPQRRVDVALVIDASSSMQERTSQNRMKITAAIEAARAFLDELVLPHDRAAVVSFNSDALLLQELTGSQSDLNAALDRIQVARQTRIDLGIEVAHAELTSPRHKPANQPVMIVLTDGKANPVPVSVAVEKARLAKADGITVFTIGLGDDLDFDALEAMASKRSYYYHAPDGEDLKGIYSEIAVTIPCPAEWFWGQRQ